MSSKVVEQFYTATMAIEEVQGSVFPGDSFVFQELAEVASLVEPANLLPFLVVAHPI